MSTTLEGEQDVETEAEAETEVTVEVNVPVTITNTGGNCNAEATGGTSDATGGEADGDGEEEKVTLCHNGNTIEVAESAVQAHLDHGDTLGPCEEEALEMMSDELESLEVPEA